MATSWLKNLSMDWQASVKRVNKSLDKYLLPPLIKIVLDYYLSVDHVNSILRLMCLPVENDNYCQTILSIVNGDPHGSKEVIDLTFEMIAQHDFDGPSYNLYVLIDRLLSKASNSMQQVGHIVESLVAATHRDSAFWMVTLQRLNWILIFAYRHRAVEQFLLQQGSIDSKQWLTNIIGYLKIYDEPPVLTQPSLSALSLCKHDTTQRLAIFKTHPIGHFAMTVPQLTSLFLALKENHGSKTTLDWMHLFILAKMCPLTLDMMTGPAIQMTWLKDGSTILVRNPFMEWIEARIVSVDLVTKRIFIRYSGFPQLSEDIDIFSKRINRIESL